MDSARLLKSALNNPSTFFYLVRCMLATEFLSRQAKNKNAKIKTPGVRTA